MNTLPFPFYRYAMVFESGLPYLANATRQMLDGDLAYKLSRSRYPGLEHTTESLLIGGFLEHVQVKMVAERGVVLHLDDLGMIEACRNSILPDTLTLDDFHLPYPFMEIRFHQDSGIPPAYAVDMHHPEYRKAWREAWGNEMPIDLVSDTWPGAWVLVTAEKEDSAKEFVRALAVDPTIPLWDQMLHSPRSVASTEELEETRVAFRVLLLALLLRREEVKEGIKKTIRGLPAKVARTMEHRPNLRVCPPLITASTGPRGHEITGNGHEVTGHWRQAHFRVLSHPRYKREENGGPQILYIKPIAVKGGGRTEKKV